MFHTNNQSLFKVWPGLVGLSSQAPDTRRGPGVQPAILSQYNMNMGGVGHSGMLLHLYKINRSSAKWNRRMFYWCLEIVVTNA